MHSLFVSWSRKQQLICTCSLYTGNKLGKCIIVSYQGSPHTLSLQYETGFVCKCNSMYRNENFAQYVKQEHSINGAIEPGKDFKYIKTLQKVCIGACMVRVQFEALKAFTISQFLLLEICHMHGLHKYKGLHRNMNTLNRHKIASFLSLISTHGVDNFNNVWPLVHS